MKKPQIRYAKWATLIAIAIFSLIVYSNQYYPASAFVDRMIEETQLNVTANGEAWVIEPQNSDESLGWLIYPGGKVESKAYVPLAIELAKTTNQRVIIVSFPLKLGILKSGVGKEWMDEYSNIERWVIVGHSLGGVAGASFANKDDRVVGLAFLASYPNASLSKEIEMISIRGSEDKVLNMSQFSKKIENFSVSSEFYVLQGGNHSQFGSYGFQKGDGVSSISEEQQRRFVVDFLAQWSMDKFDY